MLVLNVCILPPPCTQHRPTPEDHAAVTAIGEATATATETAAETADSEAAEALSAAGCVAQVILQHSQQSQHSRVECRHLPRVTMDGLQVAIDRYM